MQLRLVPLVMMLVVFFQFQASAQDERQAIAQIGLPSISTITLGEAPYTKEIDDLVQRGFAAAANITPDLQVDIRSALLISDAVTGQLTLGLSLIPKSGTGFEAGVEFLLVSNKGQVVHTKGNLDSSSRQLRSLVLRELDGNGVEINRSENRMYRLSSKRGEQAMTQSATSQTASSGTVGCLKQALGDALKPCEAQLLSAQMATCAVLIAATPETFGISDLFALAPCGAAAQSIAQTLICAGIDCGLNSGGTVPGPVINDINPKNIPVGQNILLTIDGQYFQPNLSARVTVNGQVFPIYPGAQIIFQNSNRILLWVYIGGSASTTYGVQLINPDNKVSNTYSGLIASGGQGGGNQGNTQVQISFSPNPAGPTSTSDCSRAYFFTVTVKNTGSNAVTFSSLDVDSIKNLALNQVGFQNQLGPGSQFSSGIKYCRGAGSSTWTLHSNAGAVWSGTEQLQ